MDFSFSEEQKKWQEYSWCFSEELVKPTVKFRDETETFSRVIYDQLAKAGFSGICFPEEFGGRGSDCLSYILAAEELAKIDDSLAVSLSASVMLCQWPILTYGTEAQKNKYLSSLVRGEKLGAFGLTEPDAGSDAARIQTKAVKVDTDFYLLNGNKIFITNGGEADIYVVFAMTSPEKGVKGITAFILEKGMAGFDFGRIESKMGIRSSITRELVFEDVIVPVSQRLGKEGEGFKIAMATLDGGRISVAAQALGIAGAAIDYAKQYASKRIQFGTSIGNNQGIAFMLADVSTRLEAAKLLTYRAAMVREKKKNCTQEAAMAKLYASDTAVLATEAAVQILGGRGYCRDYPVERLMRDAKITQIFEGTNEIQRMVISNKILHS